LSFCIIFIDSDFAGFDLSPVIFSFDDMIPRLFCLLIDKNTQGRRSLRSR